MAEPLLLSSSRGITHARLVKTHMATWPLVAALRTVAKPLAARHPSAQVPPAVHAQARSLLAAARRVLSREPGMGHRLVLGATCDWATLYAELEFAMTGFQAFRRRYAEWDSDLRTIAWRDQDWLSFALRRDESRSRDEGLGET